MEENAFEEAKERYPDSMLFEFIPHAAQLDYVWFYRLTDEQRLQIRLEVGEWNLQKMIWIRLCSRISMMR